MATQLKARNFATPIDSFLKLAGVAPIGDIATFLEIGSENYKDLWKVLDRRLKQGAVTRKQITLPGSTRRCIAFRYWSFDQGNQGFDFESAALQSNKRTQKFLELRKIFPGAKLFANSGLAAHKILNQIESIDIEIPELRLEVVYLYDSPIQFQQITEKDFYDFFYLHFAAKTLRGKVSYSQVVFVIGNDISDLQLRGLNFLAREASDVKHVGKLLTITNSEIKKYLSLVGRDSVASQIKQTSESTNNGFDSDLARIIQGRNFNSTSVAFAVVAEGDLMSFCRMLQAVLEKTTSKEDDFEW